MFPFPIATPQGCNIQTFYGAGVSTALANQKTWNKPPGVSHIYMMLIGAGASGDGTTGGGSGAVTTWYGAAQHVPNSLVVIGGRGSNYVTSVSARFSNSTGTPDALLTAGSASAVAAGEAMVPNQFTASGFFQSVAGQEGSTANITASATTFLSGGADATAETVTANYGYFVSGNGSGFFQMQPIIVGAGGSAAGKGGIGCGGGADSVGGPGMALIASW